MKKNFVLFMQIVLLIWLFLDMVGLRFDDNILVALSYNEDDILSALYKANICIYDDSMQPLVYRDIQKALKEIQKL